MLYKSHDDVSRIIIPMWMRLLKLHRKWMGVINFVTESCARLNIFFSLGHRCKYLINGVNSCSSQMVPDRLMKFKNIGFAISSVIPVPLAIYQMQLTSSGRPCHGKNMHFSDPSDLLNTGKWWHTTKYRWVFPLKLLVRTTKKLKISHSLIFVSFQPAFMFLSFQRLLHPTRT